MTAALVWKLLTPSTHPAAVAVIGVFGPGDRACDRLGFGPLEVGRVRVRDFGGVDRGVVARWDERSLHLMPHGGPAVVRAVLAWLASRGVEEQHDLDPRLIYPEANDRLEALMLDALANAESPLAVDLLLAQPEHWRHAARATNANLPLPEGGDRGVGVMDSRSQSSAGGDQNQLRRQTKEHQEEALPGPSLGEGDKTKPGPVADARGSWSRAVRTLLVDRHVHVEGPRGHPSTNLPQARPVESSRPWPRPHWSRRRNRRTSGTRPVFGAR